MTTVQAVEKARKKDKAKPKARKQALQAVTPHLACAGAADAIAFYTKAFGAKETMRLAGHDGKLLHAAIEIGGARIMLVDEMPAFGVLGPKALKGTPVSIHLYVDDVDVSVARAVAAGATLRMPVADMFWGDRYAVVVDPFGHMWSIATRLREMSEEEIREAMRHAPMCEAGAA